ncbi:hypothetical protein ACFT25_38100 [Streptomyces hydrogenans]|uniref:hypothetical protein n=1 Tax=Streptomyces hydrogenans TaxID=1873719 RepID=UPI00362EA250
MTAAAAADTQAPAPLAGASDAITGVLRWLSETLPGGNFTLLGLVVIGGILVKQRGAKGGLTAEDGQKLDKGFGQALKGLWSLLVSLVMAPWAVIRFYGGYETRGEPRSTATFFTAGTRTDRPAKPAPTISMATIAAAPPKVSLTKKGQPSPWARKAAAWIASYKGKGSDTLSRALRAVLWTVRAARRVHGWYKAVARVVRAVYRAVAPVVTTLARVATSWHCWPYAARGAARLAATATLLGLLVPAWRTTTLVLLALALVAAVATATRFKPKPPGDDVLYGDKIWTILRADLGLPEDEPKENWLHLPTRLADPGARIVIRLPWTFRGSELDRQNLGSLINSRLPGEWVARFSFTGEHATATYTHKPPPAPPKPDPTPPEAVDFFDPRVQEALANLAPDEFLLGVDAFGQFVTRKMAGETSHWAYSVGSGGGKSTTLQWLAVQMLMKRGTIVGVDPKLISLAPLVGVPGIHIYKDPENGQDMRAAIEWVADVTIARFWEYEQGIQTKFDPLYLFLEEANELSGLLKAVWNRIRVKKGDEKDPAGDPIWEESVAKTLRFGRAVNVHVIAVFQDFKDNEFGGVSLQPLFRFKALGNYDVRQWERITGMSKAVMPPNIDKAGRMVTVTEGKPVSYQTPYLFLADEEAEPGGKRPATEKEAHDLYNKIYRQLRLEQGYSDAGLYGDAPAHSPKGVPRLLRGRVEALSRDTGAYAPAGGSEGGLGDETAGRGVTAVGGVTPGVTPSRDRLRLIPGQGGEEPQTAHQTDPTAPPELLPLSEIARRLEHDPAVPADGTMRKHKQRRADFPRGIEKNGKELYTVAQIQAYYQPKENVAP